MGECSNNHHILSRELTWTPPGQRERLDAELAQVWSDKQQIERHIAKVETVKTRAREVQRSLAQRQADGKPLRNVVEPPSENEQPHDPFAGYDVERRSTPEGNPNVSPKGKERRKRTFGHPSQHAKNKVVQAENAEIGSPGLPKVERLIRLSELYFTGGMTEAEFTAARQRIADDERPWKP